MAALAAVLATSLLFCGSASATVRSGIPAKVRAELLQESSAYTGTMRAPFSSDMQAVRTTLAKAGHATQFSSRNLPRKTPVYVLAMQTSPFCTSMCAPQKRVLEVEYQASNLAMLRAEYQFSYPDLKKLGVPVLLAAGPPRKR